MRDAEARKTNARIEYGCYRRTEADKLFGSLPANEQAAIEAPSTCYERARRALRWSLGRTLFKLKQSQITADRHSDRIISFEQWSASHAQ